MTDRLEARVRAPRSSRHRYRNFVQDYSQGRLDSSGNTLEESQALGAGAAKDRSSRKYVREYLRWLTPHRYAIAGVLTLAFMAAGLQMIEPLFMRFIIDRVLLNEDLDDGARLARLHMAGAAFLV